MDWFVGLLLGHLFGDYVFQNSWMALNKRASLLICWLHCLIYTLCVYIGLTLFNVKVTMLTTILIFLSHIVLDYTHIVDNWMKLYGITSFTTHVPRLHSNKEEYNWDSLMSSEEIVKTTFGTFCYIVVDNTLHLGMMVLIIKYFT